VAEFARIDYIY